MGKGDIVILGAGPAGMAAAFELHKAGIASTVIEKNDQVGGLARTFQYGEFRTDIGPHRFYSQYQYLYDLIEDLLKERWIKVDRLTRFYINGKYFLYPVEWKNALANVGFLGALRILSDYVYERVKGRFSKPDIRTFEDYAISEFGRALAELNLLNYTEKIWGLKCSQVSPDWAEQRIRKLSLVALARKMLLKSQEGPKTLVDQFYYPDTGTGLIYERMKERILLGGSSLRLNSHPVKIVHDDERIRELVLSIEGKSLATEPETVFSSIPITELVNLLEPKAPPEVSRAAEHLRFRSHVSLFLVLNRLFVFPDQWIYFPDREIPFGRITEPKNFSSKMSPRDRTSLLIEFFCWEGDDIWNASTERLYEISKVWLDKIGFVKREEVLEMFPHREKYAYPVYDLGYKERVAMLKSYLERFHNLFRIGRSGCFRYNNQDHALEMGILAARSLIEGKRYNLEEVGAEEAYFERSYTK